MIIIVKQVMDFHFRSIKTKLFLFKLPTYFKTAIQLPTHDRHH